MEKLEINKILSETNNTEWFNSAVFNLSFSHLNLDLNFKGFGYFYNYLEQQIIGWSKLSENLPQQLSNSPKNFKVIKSNLIKFINSYTSEESDRILNNNFRNLTTQIERIVKTTFTYDSPETNFLIEVHVNYPKSFIGAYGYIIGSLNENLNNKDTFTGYTLAYEFSLKDITKITERRNKEEAALSSLRSKVENSLPQLENELITHLKNSSIKYEEYATAIDDFKNQKEKNYIDWFLNTKEEIDTFNIESNKKIENLEKTYQEKLKLEEPAKYWSDRAGKLKRQGWITLIISIALVLIVTSTLYKLLWTAPEHIYTSFFDENKNSAIRWSIIYITFLSFMAFAIRAVTKVMFSSFHLARDCEERHTLTYFYLSLLKDSKVDTEDKKLIMQALFSRAETGLLKDDGAPTMPNDFIGKFMNK